MTEHGNRQTHEIAMMNEIEVVLGHITQVHQWFWRGAVHCQIPRLLDVPSDLSSAGIDEQLRFSEPGNRH